MCQVNENYLYTLSIIPSTTQTTTCENLPLTINLTDENFKQEVVKYKGKVVKREKKLYIMLHKPRGFITTLSDEMDRKCVAELIKDVPSRVYPVGRLDMISEGMILLTDDGELKNRLTHPKHSLPKVYRVKVGGQVSDSQIDILDCLFTYFSKLFF